jgi:hypothetical protein
MNEELRALFERDQADRRAGPPGAALRERDRARRRRLDALLAAGAVRTPEDHYHAAMLLQHGETPAEVWRAHELAGRAAALGYRPGRWLAAAAYDRWLMYQGRPQRYGTQYRAAGGRWCLWAVEPGTTDAERAAWDVPPLAALEARAEALTRAAPPPPAPPAEPPPDGRGPAERERREGRR